MNTRHTVNSSNIVDTNGRSFFKSLGNFFSFFISSPVNDHKVEACIAEAKRQIANANANTIAWEEADRKEKQFILDADAALREVRQARKF